MVYYGVERTARPFSSCSEGARAVAKKENRVIITLACTECKRRNYSTTKNKQKHSDRLEMNKYCRFCRCHKAHKETR